jgi:hypothetical protein
MAQQLSRNVLQVINLVPQLDSNAYMLEVALVHICQEEDPHATRVFIPEYLIAQLV